MSYDPAFNNTASCISRITYIDGDAGILRYRGYPIEELAEKSTYLETAYLLLHGELPNCVPIERIGSTRYPSHVSSTKASRNFSTAFITMLIPMGMLISTIAGLRPSITTPSTFSTPRRRKKQTYRLIGKMPTIAAFPTGTRWACPMFIQTTI